ncbi:hypothetical protein FGO68_gene8030 [Halteria grandinella]|uniref:Uncharacterized protein n=1 Tax=Halteria grandinella TaxID=5974 RepID=A0A8J8NNY2_HALGN|nr:hypothetical protein FGO68_gene8030 [Halteria grandinella]
MNNNYIPDFQMEGSKISKTQKCIKLCIMLKLYPSWDENALSVLFMASRNLRKLFLRHYCDLMQLRYPIVKYGIYTLPGASFAWAIRIGKDSYILSDGEEMILFSLQQRTFTQIIEDLNQKIQQGLVGEDYYSKEPFLFLIDHLYYRYSAYAKFPDMKREFERFTSEKPWRELIPSDEDHLPSYQLNNVTPMYKPPFPVNDDCTLIFNGFIGMIELNSKMLQLTRYSDYESFENNLYRWCLLSPNEIMISGSNSLKVFNIYTREILLENNEDIHGDWVTCLDVQKLMFCSLAKENFYIFTLQQRPDYDESYSSNKYIVSSDKKQSLHVFDRTRLLIIEIFPLSEQELLIVGKDRLILYDFKLRKQSTLSVPMKLQISKCYAYDGGIVFYNEIDSWIYKLKRVGKEIKTERAYQVWLYGERFIDFGVRKRMGWHEVDIIAFCNSQMDFRKEDAIDEDDTIIKASEISFKTDVIIL